MKYKEEFKNWLPKNNVKAVASYAAYIKTTEDTLKIDLDDYFDKIIQSAIEKDFTEKKIKKDAKNISNLKSAVRKYWQFLNDKNNIG